MGMSFGHDFMQYLHAVHGTATELLMDVFALSIASMWTSSNPVNPSRQAMFSSSCAMSDMPLSTVSTPSTDAAKRIAHVAGENEGSTSEYILLTSSGTSASNPPFTGSITTIGTPCLLATSQHSLDCIDGSSQSM